MDCQYGKDTREMLSEVKEKILRNEDRVNNSLDKLWESINKIDRKYIDRLPPWATFVISFLMMAVGALVGGWVKR